MTRNSYLDKFKLALAAMVVAIHTDFLSDVSPLASVLLCQGLFRIAVPIFLLINGYYFYFAIVQLRTLDWLVRLLRLYSIWMVIYSYAWMPVVVSSPRPIFQLFHYILFGYHHLWYLAGMLPAAVLLLFVRNWREPFALLLVLALVMVGVTGQYVDAYENHFPRAFSVLGRLDAHRNFLFLSFPFFFIGYLMAARSWASVIGERWLWVAALLGVASLGLEAYLNVRMGAAAPFDNLASLLLVCPAVFALFLRARTGGESAKWAYCATAVYLIHPAVIGFVQYFAMDGTGLTLCSLTISILLALVLGRIKIIANAVT